MWLMYLPRDQRRVCVSKGHMGHSARWETRGGSLRGVWGVCLREVAQPALTLPLRLSPSLSFSLSLSLSVSLPARLAAAGWPRHGWRNVRVGTAARFGRVGCDQARVAAVAGAGAAVARPVARAAAVAETVLGAQVRGEVHNVLAAGARYDLGLVGEYLPGDVLARVGAARRLARGVDDAAVLLPGADPAVLCRRKSSKNNQNQNQGARYRARRLASCRGHSLAS